MRQYCVGWSEITRRPRLSTKIRRELLPTVFKLSYFCWGPFGLYKVSQTTYYPSTAKARRTIVWTLHVLLELLCFLFQPPLNIFSPIRPDITFTWSHGLKSRAFGSLTYVRGRWTVRQQRGRSFQWLCTELLPMASEKLRLSSFPTSVSKKQ